MPGFTARPQAGEARPASVQDTAELSFDDVRVPVANRLGEEGQAFGYLGHNLPQERLPIAVGSLAARGAALALDARRTSRSARRSAQPVAVVPEHQVRAGRAAPPSSRPAQALVDRALAELTRGELSGADAARVEAVLHRAAGRVVDGCLQLHGGYGYMLEYPIARLYADARVARIYGGTSEIMKVDHRQGPRPLTCPQGGGVDDTMGRSSSHPGEAHARRRDRRRRPDAGRAARGSARGRPPRRPHARSSCAPWPTGSGSTRRWSTT